jgi:putative glutamine amidotransferase
MKEIKILITHNFEPQNTQKYIQAIQKTKGNLSISCEIVNYQNEKEKLKEYPYHYDALILTGGDDINPKRYNQLPHKKTKIMSPIKEEIDFTLIKYFFENKKPILGICLGLQQLNVFFGGTLYQDLPDELNITSHKSPSSTKYITHPVKVKPESLLYSLVKSTIFNVVSQHHQAIKDLADGFSICAYSVNDNIIEGIEYINNSHFVVGVQWHPERNIEDSSSFNLFKNFLLNLSERK